MSTVWIAFCVGVFIGGVTGMLTLALFVAAKRGDDIPDYCHCDHADQGRACRECTAESGQ